MIAKLVVVDAHCRQAPAADSISLADDQGQLVALSDHHYRLKPRHHRIVRGHVNGIDPANQALGCLENLAGGAHRGLNEGQADFGGRLPGNFHLDHRVDLPCIVEHANPLSLGGNPL